MLLVSTRNDVWSHPDLASRTESEGIPGTIQITGATYRLIEGDLVGESRGRIAVKGRGDMETYLVVARAAVPDPPSEVPVVP